jgi:hypothetical protein
MQKNKKNKGKRSNLTRADSMIVVFPITTILKCRTEAFFFLNHV